MRRPESAYEAQQALERYVTLRKRRVAELEKNLQQPGLSPQQMKAMNDEQWDLHRVNLDDTRGIVARPKNSQRVTILNDTPPEL